MKIQQTQNLKLNSKTPNSNNPKDFPVTQVAFKGAETFVQFLRFLDTNQAWGATAVDLGCMVIPRTAVDFTRGPDAGFETMRRESSGTINHAMVGAYGLTAAWALSRGLNSKFKVDAHKMFVNNDTNDFMSQIWHENLHLTKEERFDKLFNETLSGIQAFNPDKAKLENRGFISLLSDDEAFRKAKTILNEDFATGKQKTAKEIQASKLKLQSIIARATGTESTFKLTNSLIEKTKETFSIKTLVDDIYSLSKSFNSNKVEEAFQEAKGELKLNKFISRFKNFNKYVAIAGGGLGVLVGCSVQPFNMYLTKKKTGKSGFVGVEGREPDKSKGFFAIKLLAAGAFATAVLRNIGKPSEILTRIQFKGFTPTINQFKLVYGMTIMSRFLAARDKNELRESGIKDSLGFANWLILGGFVSKLTAAGFEQMAKFKDDKFIRYNKAENGKNWFSWLTKSKIVSRDEVLYEAFKKAEKSTIKVDKNGNEFAMTFKEMMREIEKFAPEIKNAAKSKIRYLNIIQLAGYVYSGVVLGYGIPKLNIAITKSVEKKRKAKAEPSVAIPAAVAPATAPATSAPQQNIVKEDVKKFEK